MDFKSVDDSCDDIPEKYFNKYVLIRQFSDLKEIQKGNYDRIIGYGKNLITAYNSLSVEEQKTAISIFFHKPGVPFQPNV